MHACMNPNYGKVDPIIEELSTFITNCINTNNLKLGRSIHSHLIKTALTVTPFLTNRLIHLYSKCDSIRSAQKVFDDLPTKNTHSHNTLISSYARIGLFDKVHDLFDEMPERNLVSYNSLISGLTHHGLFAQAVDVFKGMQRESEYLFMDEFTFVGVVGACASLGAVEMLRQVHGAAIVIGLGMNVIAYNALIDAYASCGEPGVCYSVLRRMPKRDVVSWTSVVVGFARASRLDEALCIFDQMPVKNVVSWSGLIAGFAQNGCGMEALGLFQRMQGEGVLPGASTYVSILSACADLALLIRGKQVHGHVIRSNRCDFLNVFVFNALIDMYCKCGDMVSAMTLFEVMPERDVVTWNSIITGLAQGGHGEESLVVFERMIEMALRANHITFLGVLSACSHSGLASEGLKILNLMERDFGVSPSLDHYAIVIDMLGRKNNLKEAVELIERAPNGSTHVGMWGSLLGACQVHGNLNIGIRAAEVLCGLEPENAGRYVALSNIYAANSRWDHARQIRKLFQDRGLQKEVAYSWIEVQNTRHEFVAKDTSHSQIEEVYQVVHNLLSQMNEAEYVHQMQEIQPEDDGNT